MYSWKADGYSKDTEDTKTKREQSITEFGKYHGERFEPISHAAVYTFFWQLDITIENTSLLTSILTSRDHNTTYKKQNED